MAEPDKDNAHDEDDGRCVLGIDEAGRGPVLGPLVYASCCCSAAQLARLAALGVVDSKTLTERDREALYAQLVHAGDWIATDSLTLHAPELSAKMLRRVKYNLNEISHDAALELVQRALDRGANVTEVYVDTVGTPEAYAAKFRRRFPSLRKVVVAKKADRDFAVVSAASIVAKVTRDRTLRSWVFVERGAAAERPDTKLRNLRGLDHDGRADSSRKPGDGESDDGNNDGDDHNGAGGDDNDDDNTDRDDGRNEEEDDHDHDHDGNGDKKTSDSGGKGNNDHDNNNSGAATRNDGRVHAAAVDASESAPTNDYGSGYPSDPRTKAWLAAHVDPLFGFPSLVRFSWGTCRTLLETKAVTVDWGHEDDQIGIKDTRHARGDGRQRRLNLTGAVSDDTVGADTSRDRHSTAVCKRQCARRDRNQRTLTSLWRDEPPSPPLPSTSSPRRLQRNAAPRAQHACRFFSRRHVRSAAMYDLQ